MLNSGVCPGGVPFQSQKNAKKAPAPALFFRGGPAAPLAPPGPPAPPGRPWPPWGPLARLGRLAPQHRTVPFVVGIEGDASLAPLAPCREPGPPLLSVLLGLPLSTK